MPMFPVILIPKDGTSGDAATNIGTDRVRKIEFRENLFSSSIQPMLGVAKRYDGCELGPASSTGRLLQAGQHMENFVKYELPAIIQGGMGVGVSGWRLARAVSQAGQLGVVSGTGLDVVLARRLQLGDPGGHVRRALEFFPVHGVAERILERYYVAGGKSSDQSFRVKPMLAVKPSRLGEDLLVAANFVEVFLAKEGHDGQVGINYLEKIQLPTVPSLYGAMLAGVGWVLMGAGIPKSIPGIIDQLSRGEAATLKLNVQGSQAGEEYGTTFDPAAFCGGEVKAVARPRFLAIVSSATLATMLARRSEGRVDGFVVELAQAGGHNAPPRGELRLNAAGEPIYGPRDTPDLEAIRGIGLPFWLAGGFASASGLAKAVLAGAAGVQVGTAFAYCEESDLDPELKEQVLKAGLADDVRVFTDPVASPTGFPFKVVELEGTLSERRRYEKRERICDLGYLRQAYRTESGTIGWRCSAEPVEDFVRKGGAIEDTQGRKCLCNALLSNIGLGQVVADGSTEKPLVTSGDDVATIARFLPADGLSYSALDVIDRILPDLAISRPLDDELPAVAEALEMPIL
jgi:nitronate monooxygenase